MPQSVSPRRGRAARAVVAVAVLLAVAGYVAVHRLTGGGGPPRCTVEADGERVVLDPEQAVNASTIEAVASSRGLPERAVTIALATAMQESGLRNIPHGDRDSLGLFQQRPSQGWGTARQIRNPVYAAGKFYDHLVLVPGYSRLPLTVAAQRVQHSGYPQAYAKHEADATVLTGALVGRTAGAFRCPGPVDDGISGDPEKIRAALRREFGPEVLPRTLGASTDDADDAGDGAGGARAGSAAHDVVVPVGEGASGGGDGTRRGWELAYWAVAHSDGLHIAQVSYAGRVWSAEKSGEGWRKSSSRVSTADVRIGTER